jgi:ABC-2 type transport system permease protein
MTAFINHFAFEFKTGLRNPVLLMMNYLFPVGFYLMMGVIFTQVNPTFVETMIPAMVIVACMASMLLGLPSPLVESREAGIYRSFKINGVPAASILAVPMLTTMFHGLIAAAIIAGSAGPLFGAAAPASWPMFVLVTLAVVFSMGALGALIGVASTDSRSTVLWSQLFFLPSMLIGGLMMPLEALPQSVRPFAALLPSGHAMQAYSGLAFARATPWSAWGAFATLLGSGVLSFGLAIFLFNWDSRNKTSRGHPVMALLALLPYVVGFLMAR